MPTRRSGSHWARHPRTAALPKIDPIAPVLRSAPFNDPAWLFEPKYDGFRGMLYVTPTSCGFYSKRGLVLKQFAGLCEEVRDQLRVREAILDGEVIAFNDEGYVDFRLLMRRQGHLRYAVFDLLWLNGRDLRDEPLIERKRRLGPLIPSTAAPVVTQAMTVVGEGVSLFQAAQRLDLEGIVAKRRLDPYGPGVTWYKIKNPAYTQMEGRGELFYPPPGKLGSP